MEMSDLFTALNIAVQSYDGVVGDEDNNMFILHPIRVMLDVDTIDEQIVALLHHVVEMEEYSLEGLREIGFSEEIINAIDAITRRPNESFEDFISRISQNKLATRIMISDLYDILPIRCFCNNVLSEPWISVEQIELALRHLCNISAERLVS